MTDGRFAAQVMLCWPSGRTEINRLNARLEPKQRFSPSIHHTLSTCDSCSTGIWIGPQQLQLVNSPFVRARKLCLFCAGRVQQVLELNPQQVDVNPDINGAPKRIA